MRISIDMNKAREIWRNKIREHRKPVLEQLDVAYLRAIETQNTELQSIISSQKQALRDAPADNRIQQAETIEVLRLIDPVGEIVSQISN
jgi:hypothetical protein